MNHSAKFDLCVLSKTSLDQFALTVTLRLVSCEFAFLRSKKVRFASCAVLLTSLLLKRRQGCIESIESPSESWDDVFAPTCRGLQHLSSARSDLVAPCCDRTARN